MNGVLFQNVNYDIHKGWMWDSTYTKQINRLVVTVLYHASFIFLVSPLQDQPVTLEEALNFVGELQSGNSAEQQHQSVPQALPSGQYLPSGAEFQYLPDSLVDESEISNFTAQNQTNKVWLWETCTVVSDVLWNALVL